MELYPHQQEALKLTEGENKVAYYLDMGLGKTYVGSEKLIQLGKNVNLVVCQKSKIPDWLEHFKKHYDVLTLDLTNKAEMKMFLIEGDRNVHGIVGVINYELVWRRTELSKLRDFTLMLDESSLIQNDKAKQTKFIMKLKPDNVILLSGTPTSGKYERLWTQCSLLGWKISKSMYENQYINYELLNVGSQKIRVVCKDKPYKNVERLKRKLREHGAVFMKTEEVVDLPEKNFIKVKVDKPKMYDKFMKNDYMMVDTLNLVEFIDDSDFEGKDVRPRVELIASTSLTKRLYARQLASQYNKSKLEAVKDLLESSDDRFVIFYNFNDEFVRLKRICDRLERPVSVLNGSVKDLSNYRKEPNSVCLVQYQAGAKGGNLQEGDKIIYFSLTEKCEDWMQSQKRIHRIGQEKPCFYYILLAAGTVDMQIYNALERGVDFTDELFREGGEIS